MDSAWQFYAVFVVGLLIGTFAVEFARYWGNRTARMVARKMMSFLMNRNGEGR